MKQTAKPLNKILNKEDLKKKNELFYTYIYPYLRLIKYLYWKYSCPRQEIEDNYIEAQANLYKYINTYDPKKSIKTWIHISTKRLICDLNYKYQKFKRDNNQDINKIAETQATLNHRSEKEVSIENYRSFYSDRILNALDQLNPKYKEAFLLSQTGYSLKEIVEITHKNGNLKNPKIETVKSRIHLARIQLRTLLAHN